MAFLCLYHIDVLEEHRASHPHFIERNIPRLVFGVSSGFDSGFAFLATRLRDAVASFTGSHIWMPTMSLCPSLVMLTFITEQSDFSTV